MASLPPSAGPSPGLPLPGELFEGKYRIERRIGTGGMGVVLAALHVHLNERVAIKILHPGAANDDLARARFLREGQAAVRIRSEHVARVLDFGLHEETPYLVFEYLAGHDLADVLRSGGPLEPEVAVGYALQVCEALAVAHAQGIIHRDIKPSNLFLMTRPDGTPCVKVLDFGISKLAGSSGQAALTGTTSAIGTPMYMSPEQMRSSPSIDHRTDIWSLGIVLHELVTGAPPYDADTVPELCTMVLERPTPRLRDTLPSAPVALEALIGRCLEKNVARRFADVRELAWALAEVAPASARVYAEKIERILAAVPRAPLSTADTLPSTPLGNRAMALSDEPQSVDQAPVPVRRRRARLATAALLVAVGATAALMGQRAVTAPGKTAAAHGAAETIATAATATATVTATATATATMAVATAPATALGSVSASAAAPPSSPPPARTRPARPTATAAPPTASSRVPAPAPAASTPPASTPTAPPASSAPRATDRQG